MNGGIYHEKNNHLILARKSPFILTYDQLEAAYNIYREQFISCDFIRRPWNVWRKESDSATFHMKRRADDPSLLHEAYLQFLRLEDCNVAYNDTLEQVIDAIEQWFASGTFIPCKPLRFPTRIWVKLLERRWM